MASANQEENVDDSVSESESRSTEDTSSQSYVESREGNQEIENDTSHRSGESVDAHIAHIALATSSKMIKTGIVGGERVSKLNELLRLSEYDLIKGMMDLSFN